MKIFTIVILLFTVSCASMNNFANKVDFEQRLKENTFDSDLSLRKTNEKVTEVKVIKLEEIKDIPSTLVALSVDLEGYAVTHITKFSTDELFVVNEESLKDFARSKNCNLIVYISAKDVLRYNLYNDNKTLKVIERKGTTLFNAFLFSKVELDRKIKIDIN